jgi:protein-export membrane protein SecD
MLGCLLAFGAACALADCKSSRRPGLVLVLELDPTAVLAEAPRPELLRRSADILRRRLEAARIEAEVSTPPEREVVRVVLYGQVDAARVKGLLLRPGKLEFRLVDDRQTLLANLDAELPDGVVKDTAAYEGPGHQPVKDHHLRATGPRALARERLLGFMQQVPGLEQHVIALEGREHRGAWEFRTHLLKKEVVLSDAHVAEARVVMDEHTGRPDIMVTFTEEGAARFEKATREHVKERIAILVEGEVTSTPIIQEPILGGKVRVSMGGSDLETALAEATELASVLQAGALPASLRLLEEQHLGP